MSQQSPLEIQVVGPSLDEIREVLGIVGNVSAGSEVALPEGTKLQIGDVSKSSGFDVTTVILTASDLRCRERRQRAADGVAQGASVQERAETGSGHHPHRREGNPGASGRLNAMSADGVFVYHPLGPKTPLFELWREASKQRPREQPAVSPELLKRYRSHVVRAATRRGVVPSRARRRTGGNSCNCSARSSRLSSGGSVPRRTVLDIPVTFPTLALFDARVAEAGQQRGIFVTSRVLDVIELFARTMSLCARLNGLATPVLCALEFRHRRICCLRGCLCRTAGWRALPSVSC